MAALAPGITHFEVVQALTSYLDYPTLVRCMSVNKDMHQTCQGFVQDLRPGFVQELFQVDLAFEVVPFLLGGLDPSVKLEHGCLVVSGTDNLKKLVNSPAIIKTLDTLGWDTCQVVFRFQDQSPLAIRARESLVSLYHL